MSNISQDFLLCLFHSPWYCDFLMTMLLISIAFDAFGLLLYTLGKQHINNNCFVVSLFENGKCSRLPTWRFWATKYEMISSERRIWKVFLASFTSLLALSDLWIMVEPGFQLYLHVLSLSIVQWSPISWEYPDSQSFTYIFKDLTYLRLEKLPGGKYSIPFSHSWIESSYYELFPCMLFTSASLNITDDRNISNDGNITIEIPFLRNFILQSDVHVLSLLNYFWFASLECACLVANCYWSWSDSVKSRGEKMTSWGLYVVHLLSMDVVPRLASSLYFGDLLLPGRWKLTAKSNPGSILSKVNFLTVHLLGLHLKIYPTRLNWQFDIESIVSVGNLCQQHANVQSQSLLVLPAL